MQHLFKISPNCDEAQLRVSETGAPRTNGSWEMDVRLSRVGNTGRDSAMGLSVSWLFYGLRQHKTKEIGVRCGGLFL